MELISYDEAARILDVEMDTLKQAVLRPNVLTRVPFKGRRVLLIKEQVMLFTGLNSRTGHKKRLSPAALTPAEKQAWQRYASEATQGQVTSPAPFDEEAIRRVARQEASEIRESVKTDILKNLRDMIDSAINSPKQPAVA